MAEKVNGIAKGAQDKVQGATSGILGSIEGWGNWIAAKGKGLLDSVFPPEKRASFLAKLQSFMLKNPKLSVSSLRADYCLRSCVYDAICMGLTSTSRPSWA
jgi:hypothetical protein